MILIEYIAKFDNSYLLFTVILVISIFIILKELLNSSEALKAEFSEIHLHIVAYIVTHVVSVGGVVGGGGGLRGRFNYGLERARKFKQMKFLHLHQIFIMIMMMMQTM